MSFDFGDRSSSNNNEPGFMEYPGPVPTPQQQERKREEVSQISSSTIKKNVDGVPSILDTLGKGKEVVNAKRDRANDVGLFPSPTSSEGSPSSSELFLLKGDSTSPDGYLSRLRSGADLGTITEDMTQLRASPEYPGNNVRYSSPPSLLDESSRDATDDTCSVSSLDSMGDVGSDRERIANTSRKFRPVRSKTLDVRSSNGSLNSTNSDCPSNQQNHSGTGAPESNANSPSNWRRLSRTRSLSFATSPLRRKSSMTISRKCSVSGLQCRNFKIKPFRGGNGGLKNAVARAQAEGVIGADTKWIGTIAMPVNCIDEHMREEIAAALQSQSNCIPVFVKDRIFEGHYLQYCKQILWPILHYQTPEAYLRAQTTYHSYYESHQHWNDYKALNQEFADSIVQQYKDGDVIWVNDYHLMLVPEMVRRQLPHAKIAFFFHVSFPSSEMFRCLPQRNSLLTGMLGANCIGFQIPEYSRHFLQTCNRILAIDAMDQGIHTLRVISKENLSNGSQANEKENRYTSVVDCPIGIDKIALNGWIKSYGVRKWRNILRQRWPDIKLIVARDKLDTIRGVKQKLLAYEQFLKSHPEWLNKCVLIEIGIGDMFENTELEGDLYGIIERINSLGTDFAVDHQHVVFLQQHIEFDEYVALLCEADAFIVTPLREGMNLTSHEFVYCNRRNGSLILSEFTGAASVLGDGSLLVNPWDKMEMAEAFHEAVVMSEEEKATNWKILYEYVCHNSCTEWIMNFQEEVEFACDEECKGRADLSKRLDTATFTKLFQESANSGKRLLFLNLDGIADSAYNVHTSVPSRSKAGTPIIERTSFLGASLKTAAKASSFDRVTATYVSTQRKISVLSELCSDSRNKVYVISRESRQNLERTYVRVPDLGLIAENGAFMRPAIGQAAWKPLIDLEKTASWQKLVLPVLEMFVERDPKLCVDIGESVLKVDARALFATDSERARAQVGELITHINDRFGQGDYPLHARLENNGIIIVSARALGSTEAIEEAFKFEQKHSTISLLVMDPESVSSTADTCNNFFDWATKQKTLGKVNELCTISIGTVGTSAHWKLEGINALLNLLWSVASGR